LSRHPDYDPPVIDLPEQLQGRDFTRMNDWSHDELVLALDLADRLKALQRARQPHALLPGRTLAMIFEKPSARTRVSFAVGMAQLGGTAVDLRDTDIQLGQRETIRDIANALSRYVDAIMMRTFDQRRVDEMAEHASVPVINGLTDQTHPCQALADLQTIRERFGRLSGIRVAYLGDGNNVCRSLMRGASKFGMRFTAATPKGYEPRPQSVEDTRRVAIQQGGTVELTHDPIEAASGAQVLYTDVWTSMGQEDEADRRRRDLQGFGIDQALVDRAAPDAIVMHCLPAHYGEEITEDVLYGPQSAVWEQAENRLHAQKAVLALTMR
jgi:ornithine carbamoyltransferase